MGKKRVNISSNKSYLLIFTLLGLFILGFYLYKYWRSQKERLIYVDSRYNFIFKFPSDIRTYEKIEYPWPSHEKAYNPLIDINFATNKDRFSNGDSFYLSQDNPVKIGDILNISIFDVSLCNDKKSDDSEKNFCKKYVSSSKSSGANVGSWPRGYWIRSDKYLLFVEESPEKYSKLLTAASGSEKVLNSYRTIGDRFDIQFLK